MTNPENNQNAVSYEKFGGWLALLLLNVTLLPFRYLFQSLQYFGEEVGPDFLIKYADKTSEIRIVGIEAVLGYEAASHIALFLLAAFAAYLFWKKSKSTPALLIAVFIGSIVQQLIDYLLIAIITSYDQAAHSIAVTDLRLVFYTVLWISYLFKSQRVRLTFVQPDPKWLESLYARSFPKKLHRFQIKYLAFFLLSIPFFAWATSTKYFNSRTPEALDTKVIAKRVLESTVAILAYDKDKQPFGRGSGFFITPHLVITNAHVIKDAHFLTGSYPHKSGTFEFKRIVTEDRNTDLALLLVEKVDGIPLPLVSSSQMQIGEKIYAAGNPRGLQGTFTDGLVSNWHHFNSIDYLQISTPISPGSSGGPVINNRGEVVGVATLQLTDGQNLNFAIPSEVIFGLLLRTAELMPYRENVELLKNESIIPLLHKGCWSAVVPDLSPKIFTDLNYTQTNEICTGMGINCSAGWQIESIGILLASVQALPSNAISNYSSETIKKGLMDLYKSHREVFKSGKVIPNREPVSEHPGNKFVLDIEGEYPSNELSGGTALELRKFFVFFPFCRIDFYLITTPPGRNLSKRFLNEIIEPQILKNIPERTF